MREEVESISRTDRIWMASMKLCTKISGCHQRADRSFFLGNYQFPLCARCTGIVIGHITGFLISMKKRKPGSSSLVHAEMNRRTVPWLMLLGTVPLMIDGLVQEKTDYESTNSRRLITGILYGFSFMSVLIHMIRAVIGRDG